MLLWVKSVLSGWDVLSLMEYLSVMMFGYLLDQLS